MFVLIFFIITLGGGIVGSVSEGSWSSISIGDVVVAAAVAGSSVVVVEVMIAFVVVVVVVVKGSPEDIGATVVVVVIVVVVLGISSEATVSASSSPFGTLLSSRWIPSTLT